MRRRVLTALAVFLITLSLAGKTIHVPADYPKIQAAVNAASSGDLILIAPGVYSFLATGEVFPVTLKDDIIIKGSHADLCILDAAQASSTFHANNNTSVIIETVTIRHGKQGIKIDGASNVDVRNCVVEKVDGNGITVNSSGVMQRSDDWSSISGCRIRNCNGSGIQLFGPASIRTNLIENNAEDGISSVGRESTPIISDNTIIGNGFAGVAGIWIDNSEPMIEKNIFRDNVAGISIVNNAQPDIGGGIKGSAGLNDFSGEKSYAVISASPSIITAQHNRWPTSNPADSMLLLDEALLDFSPIAEVLFESDFSSLPLGEYYGPWSAKAGTLHYNGTASSAACYFGSDTWRNYRITFKVRERKGNDFGLIFRAQNSGFTDPQSRLYLLQRHGPAYGSLRVYRYGPAQALTPVLPWSDFVKNQWQHFVVTVVDNMFTIRHNGNVVFQAEDPLNAYQTGRVGFRVTGNSTSKLDVDDLVVLKLPDSVMSHAGDWELY